MQSQSLGMGYGVPCMGIFLLKAMGKPCGITFYAHGETPGLGLRLKQKWFQDNFAGKKIVSDTGAKPIGIVRGKVEDTERNGEAPYYGWDICATVTSKGVETFLREGSKL